MSENILQLIRERHSVREYKQIPISEETQHQILAYLEELRAESGLDIRFHGNAGKVFDRALMRFVGWRKPPAGYFSFVGERSSEIEEKCGYYGEKLVLFVQSLGLNTCWVGLFKKSETEDRTIITIAVGYGENSGRERKSKSSEQVSRYEGDVPEWFSQGVVYALLAPTAVNRQAFLIKGRENQVSIECHNGVFSAIDMGIVKYHFEQGAGKENFEWVSEKK